MSAAAQHEYDKLMHRLNLLQCVLPQDDYRAMLAELEVAIGNIIELIDQDDLTPPG